jgi:YbbR domain-containing protein
MRQWLATNTGLKIMALLFATATWFFVKSATSDWRIIENVPLEIKPPAGLSVVDTSVQSVNVTVRGTREDVRQVSRQEMSAVVDLSGDERRGRWLVKLNPRVVRHSRRVQVTEVEPPEVQVHVDELIERELKVHPQVTGELAPGFYLERVLVKPELVRFKGPKILLDALSEAPTLPIDVAARRTSFRERVELAPLLPATLEQRRWVEVDVRIGTTPPENHSSSTGEPQS